jgi:vacuolar-type H+-ATPase subunit C/Vma6
MKRANLTSQEIRKFIFFSWFNFRKNELEKLIKSEDLNELLDHLSKGPYRKILDKGIEKYRETGSLIGLEIEKEKFLLKKAAKLIPKLFPLSIYTILGYMFSKELEIKNLSIIIKSKQLRFPEAFIESHIITGW